MVPPDGQPVTATVQAGMSHSTGFDVYVALVMRDYADQNRTTPAGRYDIMVYCMDRLTQARYGEFTGSREFTSPTIYQATGAVKPLGPPPLPLEVAADGPLVDPAVASPPTGPPSAPSSPGERATGQLALPPTAPLPGADPQAQSPAGQLVSQRSDVTAQGTPWLVLVLAGAVFGALATALARGRSGSVARRDNP
ncbi:MAG: hypothetical protein ACRDRI_03435 [Pseudonocardiaceae bacterium]